jgi:type I restriction enzyme S subunit
MTSLDRVAMAMFLNTWDGSATCAIESLGNLVMGQSPPGSTYNEHGEGMVFFQGVRDFGDRYPAPRVHCTAPTRKAQAGDILIAVRAPIGEINVAAAPTAIGRGLASLTAKQPALALRALKASETTWAAYQGTGTVFSSISGPDLRKARVPAVQDSSLESALSTLDAQHRACFEEAASLRRTRDELLPLLLSGRVSVREVAV